MFDLETTLNQRKAQIRALPLTQSERIRTEFYFAFTETLADIFADVPVAQKLIQQGTLNKLEGRPHNAGLQQFGVFLGMADHILKPKQSKRRRKRPIKKT
jgi:hypothetical protein